MITIKNSKDIETMAEGGKLLAEILEELKKHTKQGITTLELDALSETLIRSGGASPAFLGYRPTGAKKAYPATLCVSVNEVVVHGTPSKYVVKEGDLVKLDLGLVWKGLYVDSAVTVMVGKVSKEAQALTEATKKALDAGIEAARPGNTLGDIGYAVESVVKKTPFYIVKSLTGHGIGKKLHEDPYVFNVGRPREGEKLQVGMVLALEPMLAAGGGGKVRQENDDGYATADGSISAHFEHTVAVTEKGPRVLTRI